MSVSIARTLWVAGLVVAAGSAQAGFITEYAVSDRDGTDFPRDGAFEFLGDETETSLSVTNQLNVTPIAERRAAFEFSLAAIPGASTISSATLLLPITGTAGLAPPSIRVFGYAADGNVTLADMLQTSNPLSGPISIAGLGTRTIDVTTFIQILTSSSVDFAGFLVAADLDTASTLNAVDLGSSNQPNPNFRTRLNIEHEPADVSAVPEPSSLALLAIGGMIGTLGLRRFRATV